MEWNDLIRFPGEGEDEPVNRYVLAMELRNFLIKSAVAKVQYLDKFLLVPNVQSMNPISELDNLENGQYAVMYLYQMDRSDRLDQEEVDYLPFRSTVVQLVSDWYPP